MGIKQEIIKIIKDINKKGKLTAQDIDDLSACSGALQALAMVDYEDKELSDIFPALEKYRTNHTMTNFQNLCIQIEEFLLSVYASTQNQNERKVYEKMLDNVKNV